MSRNKKADADFAKEIIFSDEAHFYFGGHVNKQNCRIWGTENPKRILYKDLGITPYKVQLVQELKPTDHPMRFRFAKWACD